MRKNIVRLEWEIEKISGSWIWGEVGRSDLVLLICKEWEKEIERNRKFKVVGGVDGCWVRFFSYIFFCEGVDKLGLLL